jgi:hypothetical protein
VGKSKATTEHDNKFAELKSERREVGKSESCNRVKATTKHNNKFDVLNNTSGLSDFPTFGLKKHFRTTKKRI